MRVKGELEIQINSSKGKTRQDLLRELGDLDNKNIKSLSRIGEMIKNIDIPNECRLRDLETFQKLFIAEGGDVTRIFR